MNTRLLRTTVLAFATAFTSLAYAAAPATVNNGMLVDAKGMTLYTFDKDTAGSGKSVCNGPCATLWPPAMAAGDATPDGDYRVIPRDDGNKQWAYRGKPLYRYQADAKPGDATGDKFKDVWHAAKP
jgi:predicted lipoprotein with Yx(FWY)xxD motif